ncbi:hypothetical protein GQ457_08G022560 [Hibiscus cannabinus]
MNPNCEKMLYRKRDVIATLVQRAEHNGYKVIVLTGDSPKIGRREADIKNKIVVLAIKNVEGLWSTKFDQGGGSNIQFQANATHDPSFCWEVVHAVDGRIMIFLDGGIRRGTDVFKALALSAQAVLVGRPIVFGLIAKGEDGVKQVLEMLKEELGLAMSLASCFSLKDIPRSHDNFILRWCEEDGEK